MEEGDDDYQTEDLKDILNRPLPEAYKILLKDLSFGYVSMKNEHTGEYKHYYKTNAPRISANPNPP